MSQQRAAPVLEVRGLNIAFGAREVVHNSDFHILPRETLALVGESGSGKSVTSMAVMGLLPSRSSRVSGSIKVDGKEVIGASQEVMRRMRGSVVSMIFQDPMMSLNPVLQVSTQIKEILRQHKSISDREATEEGIRLFDPCANPRCAAAL